MFGWAHGISSPGVLVPRTSIWAQKGANAVSTVITSCMFSQLFRNSRLELALVWRDHHRQITNGVSSFLANLTKHRATCLPALLAPEAHVFPKLQPPLFLFRQHIDPARCSCSRAPAEDVDGRTNSLLPPICITPLWGQLPRSAKERRRPTPT